VTVVVEIVVHVMPISPMPRGQAATHVPTTNGAVITVVLSQYGVATGHDVPAPAHPITGRVAPGSVYEYWY